MRYFGICIDTLGRSGWSGLTSFISSLELCTTVVVISAVYGPDQEGFTYQHTEVPCHR